MEKIAKLYKRFVFLTLFLSLFLSLGFLLLATSLASCSGSDFASGSETAEIPEVSDNGSISNANGKDDAIGIIVSIPPQAEFSEKIGGEKVSVTVMVPPGAEPHSYEPSPDQLRAVSKAEAYFKLGSGIEFEITWLDKIIALNEKMKVFDCAENIKLIEYSYIRTDPHIWLSVRNAIIISENICRGLTEIDPENSAYYKSNLNEYVDQLRKLDKKITESLSAVTSSNTYKDTGTQTAGNSTGKIMVYHSAWKYFARDYGLEEISVENFGKEPTIKELEQLIRVARENNIKVIFASPQFSTKSAEVVAKEIGADVVLINDLDKNYLVNMEHIAEEFKNSLTGLK
ncbi:MAG: zinc ABC transporter substrate-binding protein [Actinobacteria bacterium]|nr:zinc ABC transporter substrate-binding protein [Actinomycetota bacterium]